MAKVLGIRQPYGITLRKKFGRAVYEDDGGIYGTTSYGRGVFGYGDAVPESIYHGIYQMRKCKEGIIPVQMKFYRPTNPQTVPQQANRSKMQIAVSAWQELTNEQKEVYNKNAIGQKLTGYNLFIKNHLLSQ
jgi:hypothetical protein